jgi:serine/threonine protein kinase/predicted ATPase
MQGEFAGNQRFSIIRRLGAGGMGTVYEALDRERNTHVALKTLRNVDPGSIYRFKVEFRSLAELAHENLLPLYELFCEEDQWFFTMELLEGATSLRTFIRGRTNERRDSTDKAQGSQETRSNGPGSLEVSDAASELSNEMTSAQTSAFTSDVTSLDTSGEVSAAQSSADSEPTSILTSEQTSLETVIRVDDAPSKEERLSAQRTAAEAASQSQRSDATEQIQDYDRLRRTFFTVAQGVQALHSAGKLHRDLKPENVMVRQDGRPVLLDFGLILDLKPQTATVGEEPGKRPAYAATTDKMISGTLAYMAPEQALGSPLLNSSDWYAFGVMLFEALTGRLPFSGRSIEMVRARLTQDAPAPSLFAPATPQDLDRLCRGLLERDPAKRPGSAEIFECLSGQSATIDEGSQSLQLFIGRASYLASLNAAFDDLTGGRAGVVCVHGRSGVGKTTLLKHFLSQTVSTRGGVLLEGRCYEQESVPYKAVDNLVDALTQLLLEMPEQELRDVLPPHIQSLARVFPVLKRVKAIGRSDSAVGTANDPLLVRQQAFQALGRLLAAVGERRRLVLFIDDLQWGDVDSAQLLSAVLAQRPSPRMLLLSSYRSEYAGNACLREFRRAWESGHIPFSDIEVLPLTAEESRELATELLAGTGVPESQIERIVEQARGSAFFVQELAEFARTGVEWQVKAKETKAANAASNASGQIADLDEVLWRRVQQLPEEARHLIEMIAVAGQPIRFGDLLHTRSLESLPQHALKLLHSARLTRSTGTRLKDEIETFHDRVRESITKFLDIPVRRDYHLQIADALEQNEEAAPETIASHLEAALSPRASHFYERAGEHAMQVLAFDRAEEYLKHAAKLAPTPSDRVRIEVRLVHFYTDTARFQQAYDVGRDGAARLGFKLPRKFSPPVLLFNMARGLIRKGRRSPSDFLNLPVMTDERLIAVVSLISAMAKAAYQVRPEICVTICTIAVNLCLKYGNTPDAAIDYMVFGCIFLGGIMGRVETGYEFGRLALALIEKFENEKQRAEVNFVVGYFGTSWLRPAAEAEELWAVAFKEGQRTGDLFHTGCAVSGTVQSMIMRGVPLVEVEARIEAFWPIVEQAHLREPMTLLTSARRLIARLRAMDKESADSADPVDAELQADLGAFGARHFAHFHFLNQCMLHALTGNVANGVDSSARSAAYLSDSKGLLNTPEHYFWSAMLHAMNPSRERAAAKAITTARKKFAMWSRRCPANFAVREAVLSAEECRLRKKPEDALRQYKHAVDLGQKYQNLHLVGFANQRAALLADALGQRQAAQEFALSARQAFNQWGATSVALAVPVFAHVPSDISPA